MIRGKDDKNNVTIMCQTASCTGYNAPYEIFDEVAESPSEDDDGEAAAGLTLCGFDSSGSAKELA
jgi:hypothetical protein